jgi:ribokinase
MIGCWKVKSTIAEKIQNYCSYMGTIVVMPDFFVDRIIKLKSKKQLFDALNEKEKFGGGSIRGIPTLDSKGGNAVNVAYCLAKLGVNVTLFTIADELGSSMIRQVFSRFEDNVSLRIINGRPGYTTAFEFPNEKSSKVNVMISDIGDNANFGPDKINSENDLKILRKADGVMVVNWASNLKGTQLIEYVFKNSPKSLHFIDPADIETRKEDFRDLLEKISCITDILSINENECNSLVSSIGLDFLILKTGYEVDDVKNAAKNLAGKLGVSIDLHTRIGAAWSNGIETAFAHAINVEVKTLTGAGDSWDAADIVGHLSGLDATERLIFSNACVSLYIQNSYSEPATINEVLELLEKMNHE